MKKSQFNVIERTNEDSMLIFNSYTGALAELNKDYISIFDNLENLKINELTKSEKEIIDNLAKSGFLVKDNADELLKYQYISEKQRYSIKTLKLVIAPTLECNFSCKYCYESRIKGFMTADTQSQLIEFLQLILQKEDIKELSVMWYGGEPLLSIDIIKNLSEKFIEICNEKNLKYTSAIITNGYLIKENVVQALLKSKVNSAQITLDGTEYYHNKKRFLADKPNEGTFFKILDNINYLTENNFIVTIRMNVDKENCEDMKGLIDELCKNIKYKDKINITFAPVFSNENTISFNNTIMTNYEFSKYYFQVQIYAIEKGFKRVLKSMYPKGKLRYCSATSINSYVISPKGELYKCWNDICDVDKSIGTISDFIKGTNIELNSEMIKWQTHTPLNSEKCRKCSMLPVCSGGCPRLKVHFNEESKCEQVKYNISNIMKYYKNSKKGDK